jgi:transposase
MPITKQSSYNLKIKAIKYYYKINNYSNICKIFECSERSVKRWIKRWIKRYYTFAHLKHKLLNK